MLPLLITVSGCSTNKEKKGEISNFFRMYLDVCDLSKTKIKGMGEVVGKRSETRGR